MEQELWLKLDYGVRELICEGLAVAQLTLAATSFPEIREGEADEAFNKRVLLDHFHRESVKGVSEIPESALGQQYYWKIRKFPGIQLVRSPDADRIEFNGNPLNLDSATAIMATLLRYKSKPTRSL